jgi:predicted  nucleic acid-binding Zn-ribbon protein
METLKNKLRLLKEQRLTLVNELDKTKSIITDHKRWGSEPPRGVKNRIQELEAKIRSVNVQIESLQKSINKYDTKTFERAFIIASKRILSTDVYEEIVELAHKIKEELDQDLEFLKEFIAQ